MGYAGANAWSAAGEAAQRWAQLLGQLYQGQQQQKQVQADRDIEQTRYDDAMRLGAEDRAATATHRGVLERTAVEGERADRIERGWQPFSALGRALVGPVAGGIPGAAIPTPGMDPKALQAPSAEIGGERMAFVPPQKPAEAPYDPTKDPAVLRAQYMQKTGLARNPNLPAPRQPGEPETPSQPGEPETPTNAFTKLPADVQRQVNQISPAFSSLDRYEQLSKDYLGTNPVKRGLQKLMPGNTAKEAEIQAAQQAVLLSMKELANLGALAGPDMELVTNLIGDPTDASQLFRDPQGTLNRIGQARKFLDDKVAALESNYPGIKVQRPQQDMTSAIRSYLGTIK